MVYGQINMAKTKKTPTTPFKPLAFGAALRAAREAKSMRLFELSKKLNVSVPFLSDVENGRRPLSEDRIYIVAKFLGVSVLPLLELAARDRGKVILPIGAALDPRQLRAATMLSMNWPPSKATVEQLLGICERAAIKDH